MPMIQSAATKVLSRNDYAIPQRNNYGLAALHLCLNLFQLFILPRYLLPRSLWWGVSIIPIAAMNNPFWALIHEAIHDLLHSSPRVNLALGRLLAIFFGSPFHILRLTHLSHHKFNRSPLEKGTEIYNPREVSKLTASLKYFFYILCGLYLLEVFSTSLFFLPRQMFRRMRRRVMEKGNSQERWLVNKFTDVKRLREIRLDGVAICLVFALSALCYREHWPLLAALLMARTFLISFMDNVYHYSTPLNVTISGHNLFVPRIFSSLLLHFNLHRVHHTHPNVPWKSLPEAFARQSDQFDHSLWSAAWHQFDGPVALPQALAAAPNKSN